MNQLEKQHEKEVKKISSQMEYFFKRGIKVRIYHGSTTSTRTQQFKKGEMLDLSMLSKVLEINTKDGYAIVEPNVAMDQLYNAIIPHGFIPPVVMEFPGITVGGGIQGIAGENSSFKWGFFHETCLEYEIVLGNGKVITISPKKNPDLFWGIAGSYGSIALITKVKLKIIPAKPFIKLTYYRVKNFSEGIDLIEKKIKEPVGFVDGVFFTKSLGCVMTGSFADEENLPKSTILNPWDDWFYVHAEKITKKYSVWTELIPLKDYLFRHDRGTYWVGKYAFDKLYMPFNRFTRFIFNPLLKARTLMRLLQSINVSQRHFLQDFVFPKETTVDFMNFSDRELGIYPIYLCPGLIRHQADKLSPAYVGKTGVGFDVGVWGHLPLPHEKFVSLNRIVEKYVHKLHGRKWLYAHQYYAKDEFWKIYDKKWYHNLRKKYFAEKVFPDVYEKTYVKEKYTYSIMKGLVSVILSPFRIPVS